MELILSILDYSASYLQLVCNLATASLPPFISAIEDIALLPDAPDVLIAGCRFDVMRYSDDDYARYGVPFPEQIQLAVNRRKAEFLAGRVVAKSLLARLGYPQILPGMSDDRAPAWPAGTIGAITHSGDVALCALKRLPVMAEGRLCGIGIDTETIMAPEMAQAVWRGTINSHEYQILQACSLPFPELLTLVFSAKESLFKALYPVVLQYFDFLDAELISLDITSGRFTLQLRVDLADNVIAGMQFNGVSRLQDDYVTTVISF